MDHLSQRQRIVLLITLVFICLISLALLMKYDPPFVLNFPVVGKPVAELIYGKQIDMNSSNTESGLTTANNNAGNSNNGSFFSIGASKGDAIVKPLTGAHLNPPGAYKDGTYEGFSSTTVGILILKINIQNGKLTDISFITVPQNASTGVLSQLAQEAISNQIVEVSSINGYDELSNAFRLSLSSAVRSAFK